MQLLTTLIFIGVASATVPRMAVRSPALMALEGVMEEVTKRQVICKPIHEPFTCERSCGPGYITCISWPDCYNPGRGEVCCSNGKYCDAGTYCTNKGCCKNGQSLEECGATQTLSVIPPPAATKESSESTSHPQAPTAPTVSATITTPVPSVVTAGAGKNAEVGVLAAVGGLGAVLMAM